jgi:glucans biosynthesis protein C
MSLFMLLAGATARFALERRTPKQHLRERLLQLGLPLVVLELTYAIPAIYLGQVLTGEFKGPLWAFYLRLLDGEIYLFHLWFLFYLLIYAVLCLPLFRFLQGNAGRGLLARLAALCQKPGGLYLLALPLLAVQLALYGVSPQTLELALRNDWTRFLSLWVVFILGFVLVSDAGFQTAIARQWRLAGTVALGSWAILAAIAWPPGYNPYRDLPTDYSWGYVAFWTLFVVSSWSWLLAWLGIGQRYLNVNHPILKRASAASLPLHLLHPLVLFPSILLVARLQLSVWLGPWVLTGLVLAGTLALTAILARWRLTRFLLGVRNDVVRPGALGPRRRSAAAGAEANST